MSNNFIFFIISITVSEFLKKIKKKKHLNYFNKTLRQKIKQFILHFHTYFWIKLKWLKDLFHVLLIIMSKVHLKFFFFKYNFGSMIQFSGFIFGWKGILMLNVVYSHNENKLIVKFLIYNVVGVNVIDSGEK